MLNMLKRVKNKTSTRELLVHFLNFPPGQGLVAQKRWRLKNEKVIRALIFWAVFHSIQSAPPSPTESIFSQYLHN